MNWKLVPVEPTEEMKTAGWIDKEDVCPCDIYAAMLDVAPSLSYDNIEALAFKLYLHDMGLSKGDNVSIAIARNWIKKSNEPLRDQYHARVHVLLKALEE